ncbi:MAG: hypothetical protein JO170_26695 [Verrucomicrobia bacterium]|nr:hypothetical protein [Verrucomicrobiota bacterium]
MTPQEQAYAEALRRVDEAKATGATSLDLSSLDFFSGDLRSLGELKSFQSLDLSGCKQLSGDLSSLAELKSLQSLDLSGGFRPSGDLSSLAGLKSLLSLNLSGYCTSPEKTDTSVFGFSGLLYKQKVTLRSRSQAGINGLLPALSAGPFHLFRLLA